MVLLCLNVFNQEKSKRKAAYAELLGSSVTASVNHNFRFKPCNDGLDIKLDLAYVNMTNKFDCIDFAKAGIRVNPKNKGLFFNFYWKPHVNKVETRWAWFGLGIGYSWK